MTKYRSLEAMIRDIMTGIKPEEVKIQPAFISNDSNDPNDHNPVPNMDIIRKQQIKKKIIDND